MSREPTVSEEVECEEEAISQYIDSGYSEEFIKELYAMADDADIIKAVRAMQAKINQDYSRLIQERVSL
jgi:hypothetical protein